MQELKKIGVLAAGKIGALFGVVIGLINVVFMFILSRLPSDAMATIGLASMPFDLKLALFALLQIVVVYFVGAVVIAALYNVFAKWIGGIPVELGKK